MLKKIGIICCGEVVEAGSKLLEKAIQNPNVIVCIIVIAIIIFAFCSLIKTAITEHGKTERKWLEEKARTVRHKKTMQTFERVMDKVTETENPFLPPHEPEREGNVINLTGYCKRKMLETILEHATNGDEERNSPAHSEDDGSKLPWRSKKIRSIKK